MLYTHMPVGSILGDPGGNSKGVVRQKKVNPLRMRMRGWDQISNYKKLEPDYRYVRLRFRRSTTYS
jgi:hypothetical protein